MNKNINYDIVLSVKVSIFGLLLVICYILAFRYNFITSSCSDTLDIIEEASPSELESSLAEVTKFETIAGVKLDLDSELLSLSKEELEEELFDILSYYTFLSVFFAILPFIYLYFVTSGVFKKEMEQKELNQKNNIDTTNKKVDPDYEAAMKILNGDDTNIEELKKNIDNLELESKSIEELEDTLTDLKEEKQIKEKKKELIKKIIEMKSSMEVNK